MGPVNAESKPCQEAENGTLTVLNEYVCMTAQWSMARLAFEYWLLLFPTLVPNWLSWFWSIRAMNHFFAWGNSRRYSRELLVLYAF